MIPAGFHPDVTGSHAHRGWTRRQWLSATAMAGAGWLTPLAQVLARQAEKQPKGETPSSVILLWLAGGPSQLETFDPHPGKRIAGGTKGIDTCLQGVQLAEGYERLAEQLRHVALIRSMISNEGDHNRGLHLAKTGYRPDPVTQHPSIGAICCHELAAGGTEIPRHISILAGSTAGQGGFLGHQYDAFQLGDPANKVPDIVSPVPDERFAARLKDLEVVERTFARGRQVAADATRHSDMIREAAAMMTSEQLRAFDVAQEPTDLRQAYGDSPFGRGCLAARRLIEVGVRCVEVTLPGWDSHVNNHEAHRKLAGVLDPAFAALLADLHERDLLNRTLVLCGGEFGRTPAINPLEGRDHWIAGFSLALAGGGLNSGIVLGETDPEGSARVERPYRFADVHATILTALGIDPQKENVSPAGRPIKLSEGTPIGALLGW